YPLLFSLILFSAVHYKTLPCGKIYLRICVGSNDSHQRRVRGRKSQRRDFHASTTSSIFITFKNTSSHSKTLIHTPKTFQHKNGFPCFLQIHLICCSFSNPFAAYLLRPGSCCTT
ncbi:hypothetical protein VIGAN_02166000, partial [Vigna angularis var. angularis]